MQFEGILWLFVLVIVFIWAIQFFWPLLVLVLIYFLVKMVFFPNQRRTTSYQQRNPFEQQDSSSTYQERPRSTRVEGDVIDAEYEEREIKE